MIKNKSPGQGLLACRKFDTFKVFALKSRFFRTAIYLCRYYTQMLSKNVFPPHMSAKKQKCANNTAKENFRLKDKLKQETARLLFFMFLGTLIG